MCPANADVWKHIAGGCWWLLEVDKAMGQTVGKNAVQLEGAFYRR